MNALLLIHCATAEPLAARVDHDGTLAAQTSPRPAADDPRGRALFAALTELGFTHTAPPHAIATVTGPGPMTGTRVGTALSVALAQAWSVPLKPLVHWFGYVDPTADGWQTARVPLGRHGDAQAEVCCTPNGWRWRNAALVPAATSGRFQAGALAQAAVVQPPAPPHEVHPLYVIAPDAKPQTDALGQPLAGQAGG